MRITLFLLTVCISSTFAINTNAQTTNITIDKKNIQMKEVIALIEEQTNYLFIYNEDINLSAEIDIAVSNKPVSEILPKILSKTEIEYAIKDNYVMLYNRKVDLAVKQGDKKIRGTIVDQNGEPLIGASVIEKGSAKNGVLTDVDGTFSFNVQPNATIEISYTGFVKQEISTKGENVFPITLREDIAVLDEIVVIGYGSVKKKDLTGAVGSVKGDLITNRKSTQLSSALQGALSGVMVTRDNSAPGSSATIRIRGITTMSDNNPLIIVDGIPVSSINDINPNDVEDISVLKDAASASIYGARAAAGVIVITTKRAATDELSLAYTFEYGLEIPTKSPKHVDAVRYMEISNELRWNDAGNGTDRYPTYSKDVIENYYTLHAENPNKYPNTNWKKLIQKSSAARQTHLLSVSGASKFARTKASIAYDDIEGIYANKDYERYSVRINNDMTISKMFSASFDVDLKLSKYNNPASDPLFGMRLTPPIYAALWDDGRLAEGKNGDNVYASLMYGGFNKKDYYQAGGKASLDFTPIKDLKVSAVIAPRFFFEDFKSFNKKIPYYAADNPLQQQGTILGHTSSDLSEDRNKSRDIIMQLLANYNKSIGNHSISLMAGYESKYFFSESLGASREKYELDSYPYLDRGPLELRKNSGSASENAYRSFFGRVIYNFKNRYLLQANVRQDGSSRFASGHRWGTFPSVSLGWIVSEENFIPKDSKLSFLKLRTSWGRLGNERIGNYPYQALLTFYNALFHKGGIVNSEMTAAQVQYAIHNITWETTESIDLGLDVSFFNNKLRLTADYYSKKTKDMLLDLEIPAYVGYDNPSQNAGEMKTKGFDLDLAWDDQIGDWKYGVSVNLSDFVSKMGNLKGTQFLGDKVKMHGSEYDEWRGYRSGGLFQTQEELDNHPKINNSVKVGDIKYLDLSGPNGQPDGIINDHDKVLLGGSLPRYTYGGTLRLGYKNFDFSMAFQGVGKQNVRMQPTMIQPLRSDWGNIPQILDGNYWSHNNTDDQNLKAKYPRLTFAGAGANYNMSDFWMFNGRYFRLKNITLGYTIPKQLLSKIKIKNMRVYANASDLFSIDSYPSGWDPEMGVSAYPITTSLVFGLSVNF